MMPLRYEITIRTSAEVIYRHFTERDGLLRWIGVEANARPVPGGELTWTHENGATMLGRFVELDPPRRILFTYGWKDDLMGLAPESTTVEVRLEEERGHTRLILTHDGLTDKSSGQHEIGWRHFLKKLDEELADATGP